MLKSFSSRMALAMLGAVACFGVTSASAADKHPDFSGIWTVYVEHGKDPFGSAASFDADMNLPFTPEGKAKVLAYRALVAPTKDGPGNHCVSSGMPRSMEFSGGYPMEIIQRPEQITIVYEADSEIRRLYFGNKIIPPGDRVPARDGYSTAHWEGNTLVVETGSLKE